MRVKINPYAPAIVFRHPRTKEAIVGILHSIEDETGKIRVIAGRMLYVIRRQMIELIQY